jgi:glycosyltransferase involved in cell wall biosynthesis
MRILFVCAFLNDQGGFENHVHASAQLAIDSSHSVSILTPGKVPLDATVRALEPRVPFDSAEETWRRTVRGKASYSVAWLKHTVTHRRRPTPAQDIRLASSRKPRDFVDSYWRRHALDVLPRFDLVHAFGKPKAFVVEAIRCAEAVGRPVIYEELAQVGEAYASRDDHRRFVGASNLCTRIVTIAEENAHAIRQWFGYRGDVDVIDQWAFFDERRLLDTVRDVPATATDSIVFGSLSRLGHEKGLTTLLHAFAEARAVMPALRLKIAGSGAQEAAIKRLAAELRLGDGVQFLPYVSDRVAFFEAIDAFIIASEVEGGPITGVEAMAAGLPIVTTPVGAMPERLKDHSEALFVPVNSTQDLKAAMLRIASDGSLRRRLAAAARGRYLTRNHSSVQARKKVELWNTVGAQPAAAASRC